MNTDKLNTDFMDMQAIALKNTMGMWDRRDIILLTRNFKEHLDELETALGEKGEKDVLQDG